MKTSAIREIGLAVALAALLFPTGNAALAAQEQTVALERLAKQGNAKAQYHLGMMYLTGTSVEANYNRAVEYFRSAAELGDPLASYKLGCFYDGQYDLFEVDLDLALKHKLVAAQGGYALAQQDVASLYYRRDDVPTALEWMERAVAQGTVDALATYASIHNGAPGVAKDPVKTAAFFRLFLNRTNASSAQRTWLRNFEAAMSDGEREQANEIVKNYTPAPTALTIEALSGAQAADALIDGSL